MNRAELKKNFLLLIDSIENEKLLVDFYELIKKDLLLMRENYGIN